MEHINSLEQNFLLGDAMNPEACLRDVDALSALGVAAIPEVESLLKKFSHHPMVYNTILDYLKMASTSDDPLSLKINLRLADLVGMREVEGLEGLFSKLAQQVQEQKTPVTYPEGVTIGEQIYPSTETGRLTIVQLLSDGGATSRIFEVKGTNGRHAGETFIMKVLRKEYWSRSSPDPEKMSIPQRFQYEYNLLQKLRAKGASVPEPIALTGDKQHPPLTMYMSKAKGETLQAHRDKLGWDDLKHIQDFPETLALKLAIQTLRTLQIANDLGISYLDWDLSAVFWDGKIETFQPEQRIPAESVTMIDWNVVEALDDKDNTPAKNAEKFCINWFKLLTGKSWTNDPRYIHENNLALLRLSPNIQTLLLRGLNPTRLDRWISTDEMIAEIHRILAEKTPEVKQVLSPKEFASSITKRDAFGKIFSGNFGNEGPDRIEYTPATSDIRTLLLDLFNLKNSTQYRELFDLLNSHFVSITPAPKEESQNNRVISIFFLHDSSHIEPGRGRLTDAYVAMLVPKEIAERFRVSIQHHPDLLEQYYQESFPTLDARGDQVKGLRRIQANGFYILSPEECLQLNIKKDPNSRDRFISYLNQSTRYIYSRLFGTALSVR